MYLLSADRLPREPVALDPVELMEQVREPLAPHLDALQTDAAQPNAFDVQSFGLAQGPAATQALSRYAAGAAPLEARALLREITSLSDKGAHAKAAAELTRLDKTQLAALLTGASLGAGKPGLTSAQTKELQALIQKTWANGALNSNDMARIGMAYATGPGRNVSRHQLQEFLHQLGSQDQVWPWDFHRIGLALERHRKLTAVETAATWKLQPDADPSLAALLSSSPLLLADLRGLAECNGQIDFQLPASDPAQALPADKPPALFAGDAQPKDLDLIERLWLAGTLANKLHQLGDPNVQILRACSPATDQAGATLVRQIQGAALFHEVAVLREIMQRHGATLERKDFELLGIAGRVPVQRAYSAYQKEVSKGTPEHLARQQAVSEMGTLYFANLPATASDDTAKTRFEAACPRGLGLKLWIRLSEAAIDGVNQTFNRLILGSGPKVQPEVEPATD